jgi:transposase
MKKSIARLIRALQKELDSVETDIDDMVRGTPVFAAKEDLLSSVLGHRPCNLAHADG